MTRLNIPTSNGFPWFQSGTKWFAHPQSHPFMVATLPLPYPTRVLYVCGSSKNGARFLWALLSEGASYSTGCRKFQFGCTFNLELCSWKQAPSTRVLREMSRVPGMPVLRLGLLKGREPARHVGMNLPDMPKRRRPNRLSAQAKQGPKNIFMSHLFWFRRPAVGVSSSFWWLCH